jgi:hypothetical protein
MREKYRTDYQIREWKNLGELALLLNTLVNEGWRVDSHKLSGGSDNSGWTIFMRSVMLDQPLLERDISVSAVYHIINANLIPGSDESRKIDADIKKAVRLPGDDR